MAGHLRNGMQRSLAGGCALLRATAARTGRTSLQSLAAVGRAADCSAAVAAPRGNNSAVRTFSSTGAARTQLKTLKTSVQEALLHSPPSLLFGVAIGGFVATVGGLLAYMHLRGEDLRGVLDVEKVELKIRRRPGTAPVELEQANGDSVTLDTGDVVDIVASPAHGPGAEAGSPGELNVPIPPHYILAVAWWSIAFAATSALALTRARLRLHLRQFLRDVNYSLNSFEQGHLRFRTVKEAPIEEVGGGGSKAPAAALFFLFHFFFSQPSSLSNSLKILLDNSEAQKMVIQRARQTTMMNPFISLPNEVSWLVTNSVLNSLSPIFAEGFFRAEQGLPVRRANYVIGLTYEPRVVRSRKLRVMIVAEDLLRDMSEHAEQGTVLTEFPTHSDRKYTLMTMSRLYKNIAMPFGMPPAESGYSYCIMRMEVALPVDK